MNRKYTCDIASSTSALQKEKEKNLMNKMKQNSYKTYKFERFILSSKL